MFLLIVVSVLLVVGFIDVDVVDFLGLVLSRYEPSSVFLCVPPSVGHKSFHISRWHRV